MDPSHPTSTSGILAPQAQTATAGEQALPNVSSRPGYFRWVICTLLLFGTTKNYMDRNVLGVLNVTLQHTLGWNEIDYSNLVVFFQLAYAAGMLLMGRVITDLARDWVTPWRWSSGASLRWGLHWGVPSEASRFRGLLSDLGKPLFFPPASRRLPNGFRRKSVPCPREFSMRVRA